MITHYPAARIAHELGISVLSEDAPKLVSAIHRAYATGQRDAMSLVEDAVAIEREACAQIADDAAENVGSRELDIGAAIADAIRTRSNT